MLETRAWQAYEIFKKNAQLKMENLGYRVWNVKQYTWTPETKKHGINNIPNEFGLYLSRQSIGPDSQRSWVQILSEHIFSGSLFKQYFFFQYFILLFGNNQVNNTNFEFFIAKLTCAVATATLLEYNQALKIGFVCLQIIQTLDFISHRLILKGTMLTSYHYFNDSLTEKSLIIPCRRLTGISRIAYVHLQQSSLIYNKHF